MSRDHFFTLKDGTFVGVKNISEIRESPPDSGSRALLFNGEAEGAIPNDARVEKCNTETSDALLDGAQGKVLSSFDLTSIGEGGFLYFVEWDAFPGVPVAIHSKRVRAL